MKPNYPSLFSFFRKSIALLAICIASSANAQVANYLFSQVTGTYTPITGGTVLATGAPPATDDQTYGSIPIGFPFIYNATSYNEVSISANGYVRFGTTVPGCCWYNGTSMQNEPNSMHPFSEDLYGNNANCEIRYETSGAPGSQVFVIQWKDWGFWNTGSSEINFQVKLYEGTNIIEFTYSPSTINLLQTCQVGLTGVAVTDFNGRTTTNDWSATNPSAANTDQMTFSPSVFPVAGLSYYFMLPPIDVSPVSLVAPVPDQCYTANETVTVRVQNIGSQTIDFSTEPLTVNCSVAGPNPQVFPPVVINSGTLAPSSTQDVVITTTYDMTLTGTYSFTASANTPNDANALNDNIGPIDVEFGVASSSVLTDTICVGASATLTLTGFNGPIQWQSWDGSSWVNETGPGNNSTPYTVNPAGNTDYRAMLCGSAFSNTISVYVVNPVPPVTTGDTRCGYGPVNLSATGVGNMVWYAEPTGGIPLFTGTNYSPIVSTTDTFYVESTIGSANPGPLTTTFAGGNGQNGNMFNITALQTVTITNFDGHMATGTQDWTIYYRTGTFIGFETDSSTWTNLGTAVGVVAQGAGVPTPIPLTFSVTIPAGQTYGFYVTAHSGTVAYTNGTALDAVYVQDANIQVREGKGNQYPFAGNFSPRIWNGVVHYTSGCASASRTPVIATVTPPTPISVSASQTVICGLPASTTVTLNASSANLSYNYTWAGADLNQTSGPSVTATPNATTTYIVTGDDGVCGDTTSITIILTPPPPAAAIASPFSPCFGSPSQLNTPSGPISYTVNSIAYAPVVFTGNAGPVGDNVLSGVQPIGFTFNYFGTDYTQFNMSTNGNIQFGPTFSTSGAPAVIPAAAAPNNYIGVPWANLSTIISGNITWATLGVAPNRTLVVEYNNMGFNTGGGSVTSQIILYEGTNCIEIHAGLVDNTTLVKTMGIENQNGTLGYAPPGRNQSNWNFNTPEAWSFCPMLPYTFSWTPTTWLNDPNIHNPILTAGDTGNFTYDVTVTDITSGCTSTSSVTVSVLPIPGPPTTTGDTRCGFGVVNLSASGAGDMVWYTQPTGGSPLFTGNNYSPSVGVTTTFYVEASVGSASSGPLTTTFAAGNGSAGNMFDITALTNVTITHFDAHVATGTHTFEIWYRPGSYVGFQNSSAGWTQLGTATGVVAAGTGVPTPVPIMFAVQIPAGQTYGFYVTSTTGTVSYTNGTAVGNVYAQDANIQVREGHGGAYFNLVNNPRVFNGNVYYESGCASGSRTPVTAIVTPADTIIATPTSNPMCLGTPITITVASTNSSYSYSWTPTTNISNPTEDTVTANPSTTTLYTINAIDTAGCETSTTVNLVVNPAPIITATADPITICAGTPTQLDINDNSQPLLFTVGTGTAVNTTTSYPAPFGNFWTGDRNQQLYLASELQAAGLGAGPIVSVGYDIVTVNTPALGTYTNFTVSIGTTAQNAMTNTFVTGLTQVFYAASILPVVGWNTLTFSTPFMWDGVSNIVVETTFMQCPTCPSTPCINFTTNCIHRRTTTSFVSSIDSHADNNCAVVNATTGTTYSVRPNTQFGAPSDVDYIWTPNVSLSSDTIVNPVASPTATTTYTVSVSDNYWNCTSTSSITVNVNPLPVVNQSPLNGICIDGSPLPLSGGTPTGGIYSGPGVTNNTFYPTVAGVGTHTIVYTYTDNLGCVNSDSTTIVVNDLPIVVLPTFPTVCVSGTPVNLNTGTPLGGTYSGPGVIAGMFDPNAAGIGIHGITYTYTDGNGCTNSMLRNIVVNDSPVANAGPDINGNATITGASASGGTPPYTYIWSPCLDMTGCNTLTPFANPQVNTFYVLYVVDANGCYSTDTVLVTSTIGIAPIPVENSGLLVYPNPASGLFNVLFLNPSSNAEVTIVNAIGQEVFKSGTFTAPSLPYQVNLGSQPDGIYIMHVKYRDRIITTRLVLSK